MLQSNRENCVQIKYLWSVTFIVLQKKANQVWETKPQARTTLEQQQQQLYFYHTLIYVIQKKITIKCEESTGCP